MRIVFCGGGTAGHITPAIAIAERIKEYDKNAKLLFIGRDGGEENEAVKRHGFKLECIRIFGIHRRITLKNIKNTLTAISATKKARDMLQKYDPDIVIGTGGYVSWPVISAAQRLKIPTIIHESNATPGLVTKLLASKCDRVLLSMHGSEKNFKKTDNIKVVGNPIIGNFINIDKKTARKKLGILNNEFLILSFGGSGGSKILNDVIIKTMISYSQKNKNIRHVHASGRKYYDSIKTDAPELTNGTDGCIIKRYIDDMPTLLSAADLVISRCGAMTLTEISATSTASILIPSPNVTNNHQYENAKLLKNCGAAVMIEESELSVDLLTKTIEQLKNDPKYRSDIEKKIREFYVKDANDRILREITSVLEGN